MYCEFKELLNKTLKSIEINQSKDEIVFTCVSGEQYKMSHYQDCCESVSIEDICGDMDDLVGHPILLADESSNSGEAEFGDSYTWTFYKLGTIKGGVTIRWYGQSNGYYSESVNFEKIA